MKTSLQTLIITYSFREAPSRPTIFDQHYHSSQGPFQWLHATQGVPDLMRYYYWDRPHILLHRCLGFGTCPWKHKLLSFYVLYTYIEQARCTLFASVFFFFKSPTWITESKDSATATFSLVGKMRSKQFSLSASVLATADWQRDWSEGMPRWMFTQWRRFLVATKNFWSWWAQVIAVTSSCRERERERD